MHLQHEHIILQIHMAFYNYLPYVTTNSHNNSTSMHGTSDSVVQKSRVKV